MLRDVVNPEAKSFASRENAVKKLEKVFAGSSQVWHYSVAINAAGRFVPVIHLTNEQTRDARGIADHGVMVVRG